MSRNSKQQKVLKVYGIFTMKVPLSVIATAISYVLDEYCSWKIVAKNTKCENGKLRRNDYLA